MYLLRMPCMRLTAQFPTCAGGTNVRDGKYIYTEDLLVLEALSRGGTNEVENLPTPILNSLPLDH